MDANRLAEIERVLVEACEWAVENGWTLEGEGDFGDRETMRCCALGAVGAHLLGSPSQPIRIVMALGVEIHEALAIGNGFDGDECVTDPEHHAIGQRLRQRFLGAA
jgi:hypothetical protein